MSLIYNDSRIYCSDTPFDPNNINTNLTFPLSHLFFCPICQEPRATHQTSYDIESKFCANCLTDYSNNKNLTHCIKNCFECPDCHANLSITMTDHDNKGKSFNFNCVYCEYSYVTSVIYKPKSLHAIVDDEKRANPDSFHQLCDAIRKGVLGPEEEKSPVSKNIELMLQQTRRQEQTPTPPTELDLTIKSYPQARKLTTKTSHRCCKCHNLVLAYANDKTQPTINKFAVKFSAVDYLPTISISNLFNGEKFSSQVLKKWNGTTILMIHLINPMSVKCTVNISIPSSYNVAPEVNCKITIPLNQVTLGPTSTNLIKTIPSCFLTSNTPTGKRELILRKGDVMHKPPASFEEVEENLNNFVERGINWYSIPVIINLDGSNTFNFRLPVYITLKSELPDVLKKIPGHDALSVGYWNVIDLGSVSLV
ncbi:uncharacterized protein SPAPADRAFT_70001 [Spathaspora passalidarum NRRL Y-27907]|uniref:Dynactin subunit 4 n=1 Tax=Spathaspora passalidarum (strain NRRL Y-27907 / 11-Y1) TaxID=619300 RepID=G3AIJ9_SPAPN|nr:uncharacterized protein SPAPADRAFT_70001 [Spathaspora passalidarum NRRL Y-27907]EGW33715.1 hypothetical protein SPAPADRAFT_70001 [Spathaspora passalidarum NRRL Y-27907]